jgi:hypothetical protein
MISWTDFNNSNVEVSLAKLTTITFYPICADTFWIHAPYLIGESGVKLKYEKAEFGK